MKKQYLSALLFLALVFGVFSSVSAQDAYINTSVDTNTSVNTRAIQVQAQVRAEMEARRAQADTKREAARVLAETKRAEMRAKRAEFQQDIAKRKVEHTAKVILATIEHLEKIIVRLESRIAKVKAMGGVTTESEGFVASAKVNLSNAKTSVGAFASLDLSGEKARDNFERIRVAAAEAREHIRAAHRNLMMAVRLLGSIEMDLETTATSTSGR